MRDMQHGPAAAANGLKLSGSGSRLVQVPSSMIHLEQMQTEALPSLPSTIIESYLNKVSQVSSEHYTFYMSVSEYVRVQSVQ